MFAGDLLRDFDETKVDHCSRNLCFTRRWHWHRHVLESVSKPEVQMIYLDTSQTNVNDWIPKAVFKVVNSGSKPAHIRIANAARKDGDAWRYDLQFLGMLE